MKLISLIDNTAVDDKLFSENGMSFFVEFGGKNYIIDTGLTGKAAENARRMQLPTDELDAVVLTHNHAAHVGGIDSFMRLSPDAEIYLRAGAQTERFRKTGFFKEPVGAGKAFFKKYADDLILFNRFSEVAEGFYLASCETFDEKDLGATSRWTEKSSFPTTAPTSALPCCSRKSARQTALLSSEGASTAEFRTCWRL